MRKRMWCARPSVTAQQLARRLDMPRLRREGTSFHPEEGDKILNWGSTFAPHVAQGGWFVTFLSTWINHPSHVLSAVDKRRTFHILKEAEIRTPTWTTSIEEAHDWLHQGSSVVCRATATSYGARGLSIVTPTAPFPALPPCPLYTKYVKKEAEYRVHVMNGLIIYIQKKCRRLSTPNSEVNWQVRNHANGFIYAECETLPERAKEMAISTVKALGLDFGAVDIIETHSGKFYILECNSAPMLVNRSLDKYVYNLRRHYGL